MTFLKGFYRVRGDAVPNLPQDELTPEKRCLHCLVEWTTGMYETYNESRKKKLFVGKRLPSHNKFERKCMFCNKITIILSKQTVERVKTKGPKEWNLRFINKEDKLSAENLYSSIANQKLLTQKKTETIQELIKSSENTNKTKCLKTESTKSSNLVDEVPMKKKTAGERLLESLIVTKPDKFEDNDQSIEELLMSGNSVCTVTQTVSSVISQTENINDVSKIIDTLKNNQTKDTQGTLTKEEMKNNNIKTENNELKQYQLQNKIEDELFLKNNLEAKQMEIALIVQEKKKNDILQKSLQYSKHSNNSWQMNDFQAQDEGMELRSLAENKAETVQKHEHNVKEDANESNDALANSSFQVHAFNKDNINAQINIENKKESEQIGLGVPKTRRRKHRKHQNKNNNIIHQESELNKPDSLQTEEQKIVSGTWLLGNKTEKKEYEQAFEANDSNNSSDTKDMFNEILKVTAACGVMSLATEDKVKIENKVKQEQQLKTMEISNIYVESKDLLTVKNTNEAEKNRKPVSTAEPTKKCV